MFTKVRKSLSKPFISQLNYLIFEGMRFYPNSTSSNLIRQAVALFFLIGIFMSLPLWNLNREFPVVPLFSIFSTPHIFVNRFVFALLIFALTMTVLFENKRFIYLIYGCSTYLLIEDQIRWQPWVYTYLLTLFPYSYNTSEEQKSSYLRVLFIGIYIWSGIHKINPYFNDLIVESFAIDIFRLQNPQVLSQIKNIGTLIPIFEITSGVLLIFKSTRSIALYALITMHIFILLYLSPFVMNGNYIVYPWNILMVFSLLILFSKTAFSKQPNFLSFTKSNILVSILLFSLTTPILLYSNIWSNFTSFSLYSGNTSNMYLLSAKNIPHLTKYKILEEEIKKGEIIDLNLWSSKTLNVPIPPEKRIFNEITKQLSKENENVVFITSRTPLWKRKILQTYVSESDKQKLQWINSLSPIYFNDSVYIKIDRKFKFSNPNHLIELND